MNGEKTNKRDEIKVSQIKIFIVLFFELKTPYILNRS